MYSQNNATGLNKLREILPKSGMKYLEKSRIMSRQSRDKQVSNALTSSGYELSTTGIHQAFAPMFQIAVPIFIDARAEGKDLWDILPIIQRKLDWARRLAESVFFELFTRLVEARCRWEQKPVPPFFDYHQYTPLVIKLVQFRKVVGDCPQEDSLSGPEYKSWILADAEVYNVLAGGIYEDDEDMGTIQHDECDGLIAPMANMVIKKPEEYADEMELDN
ncbi:hypothetical protein F4859DRAFT_522423 [Xylaria cf. heliscus]|nr:hypothetical protein F4859DRAFT_522423 [Xylaria cf. heliscus]